MTERSAKDPEALAEKQAAIKKQRALETAWAVFTTIGVAELLFASFAFGAANGPGPLRSIELIVGLAISFLLGAIASITVSRKRVEKNARLVSRVREGDRDRRVVVFDEYLTIGSEIVVKSAITQAEVDPLGLVLRYRDPAYEGVVLRELQSDRVSLETLASAISAPAKKVPQP